MANFGSISSLASVVNMFAGADPVKAEIIPLDDTGNEQVDLGKGFQYFPEQISDSKSANYSSKNIPGGSHPLYQFISGGDRTISFTAIFTSDEDPAPPSILGALQGGLDISFTDLLGAVQPGRNLKKHTVPVDSAVIWLRSFMYPRYTLNGNKQSTVAPPPVCRLYLPNSNIHGTTAGGQLVLDSIDCIMVQCDVVYETMYRNGTQRITTVNLTLNETIQTGSESWKFTDGQAFTKAYSKGQGSLKSYPIKSTKKPELPGALDTALDAITSTASSLLGF